MGQWQQNYKDDKWMIIIVYQEHMSKELTVILPAVYAMRLHSLPVVYIKWFSSSLTSAFTFTINEFGLMSLSGVYFFSF